jgi:pimeloyl-ACP methyl ester carboxylesterase
VVEGAGHTVHLEQPGLYTALVSDFLARHKPKLRVSS